MLKVERVFSSKERFSPNKWIVLPVKPLITEEGECVGFYETFESEMKPLDGLPTEIFNHEMKSVDTEDPFSLASFMSKFGILGRANKDNFDMGGVFKRMKMPSIATCDHLEERLEIGYVGENINDMLLVQPFENVDLDGIENMRIDFYAKLYSAVRKAMEKEEVRFITSVHDAVTAFSDLLNCSIVVKALSQSNDPGDLSKLIGVDEAFLFGIITGHDQIINHYLKNITPQIGYRFIDENDGYGKPSYDRVHNEFRGSPEEAISLQLWDFALNRGDYKTCKECKTIFCKKRASKKTQSSRSTSEFCCDRCRNRYTQRAYRNSPGYKLKQQKKKNASTTKGKEGR